MATIDYAEELDGTGVTVNALHPATLMPTTMVREAGVTPISTVAEGANATLRLICDPSLAQTTGRYFNNRQVFQRHPTEPSAHTGRRSGDTPTATRNQRHSNRFGRDMSTWWAGRSRTPPGPPSC
ncbi:hypothetical protein ACFRAQ_08850 [Nocardia sp. NPDC056611]|uniref:hypothetical protein n=1 Tax=Nocardia sp. NPDC056611 TaxID=3345877 RepID=UPI00366F070D